MPGAQEIYSDELVCGQNASLRFAKLYFSFDRKRKVAKENSALFVRQFAALVELRPFRRSLRSFPCGIRRYALPHGARIPLRSALSVQKGAMEI
jgi:hypothetical protein